jgi:hypothetical protein
MTHLSHLELSNWIALYLAAGLCCAIAIVLSVASLGAQMYAEKAWNGVGTRRDVLLFLPRTWWRWQKLYLLSTPVTLAVVLLFAASMSWS